MSAADGKKSFLFSAATHFSHHLYFPWLGPPHFGHGKSFGRPRWAPLNQT
jgi:hypothetical protein